MTVQSIKDKLSVIVTSVFTLLVLIIRIIVTPQMQDTYTGHFEISYAVIAILAVGMIAVLLLSLLFPRPEQYLTGKPATITSAAMMICGSVLLLSNVYDFIVWMLYGRTPPPNLTILNNMDAITLFLSIAMGIIGGAYFIRMGLYGVAENGFHNAGSKLCALAPTLWIWMRLARYEMSYASAISVTESFYDFVMLIFTMLFFFGFARYITGIKQKPSRVLVFFALCTAMFTLSGTLTRFAMYLMNENFAFNASRLAGVTDFAVGIFALTFAWCYAFNKNKEVSEPEVIDEPMETSLDDILDDIYKDE